MYDEGYTDRWKATRDAIIDVKPERIESTNEDEKSSVRTNDDKEDRAGQVNGNKANTEEGNVGAAD